MKLVLIVTYEVLVNEDCSNLPMLLRNMCHLITFHKTQIEMQICYLLTQN